jgi:HK97 family phage prohead protease
MRIEIRNNQVILDGYVNAVCRDSKPLLSPQGLFVEQIKEGVFQRALDKAQDVKLLFNHKNERELGSIVNGNLQLFEDSIGLRAICTVDDPEVVQKAKDNQLKGWSFGFYSNKDDWQNAEPYQRRFIEDMDLLEVSILDKTPAYNGTSIESRDNKEVLAETRGEDFKAIVEDLSQEQPQIENVSCCDNCEMASNCGNCNQVSDCNNQDHLKLYDNSKFHMEMLKAKQFK